MVVHACYPNVGEGEWEETGESLELIVSQPTKSMSSRFSEKTCLRKKGRAIEENTQH